MAGLFMASMINPAHSQGVTENAPSAADHQSYSLSQTLGQPTTPSEKNSSPTVPHFRGWEAMNFSYSDVTDITNQETIGLIDQIVKHQDLQQSAAKNPYATVAPQTETQKRRHTDMTAIDLTKEMETVKIGYPILYSRLDTKNGPLTIAIPVTPECSMPFVHGDDTHPTVYSCTAYAITSKEKQLVRFAAYKRTCFIYTGNQPPDSPLNSRQNGVYINYDDNLGMLLIYGISQGKPLPQCTFSTKPIVDQFDKKLGKFINLPKTEKGQTP